MDVRSGKLALSPLESKLYNHLRPHQSLDGQIHVRATDEHRLTT